MNQHLIAVGAGLALGSGCFRVIFTFIRGKRVPSTGVEWIGLGLALLGFVF